MLGVVRWKIDPKIPVFFCRPDLRGWDADEIDTGFAARACENLRSMPQVNVQARSGLVGDLPKADAIYVLATESRLPDMDGYETMRSIRARGRYFRFNPNKHSSAA